MSAFKGTPGPWEVLNARKEDWIGRPLDYWTVTAEGHDKWLCASPEWDPEHDEESTANARLIAAAPELLAAAECDAAMDLPTEQGWLVLERHGWNREDRFARPASAFVRRLRAAAIAKATGGAA